METTTLFTLTAGIFVGWFADDIAVYAGSRKTRIGRFACVFGVYVLGVIVGHLP